MKILVYLWNYIYKNNYIVKCKILFIIFKYTYKSSGTYNIIWQRARESLSILRPVVNIIAEPLTPHIENPTINLECIQAFNPIHSEWKIKTKYNIRLNLSYLSFNDMFNFIQNTLENTDNFIIDPLCSTIVSKERIRYIVKRLKKINPIWTIDICNTRYM